MSFDWNAVYNALPTLLDGVKLTLLISVLGIPSGFILGLFLGMARAYRLPILNFIALIYIEIIRGTPMILQVMFIYFALPQISFFGFHIRFDAVTAGIITIMINSAAYMAEIVRGALLSVHNGLREAGLALGLPSWKVVFKVILPIAWRRMIPPLGNQCIISLKDTSLLSVVSIAELMRRATEIASTNYNYVEILSTVAVLYLILTVSLTILLRIIEKRIRML
ncbi:ABC transporter permease subunit [Bartonella tamiae]|uniref:Glutamate/aspartate import permease protein GltK n=1 Tax=Bartonella tamiae Th239 TaxID=1094558 RepID=J0ZSJ3_9HYPH|nr:ABC transporter permease subunit [Bartonella tamiae]EJF91738.1 His/Glu/Gln/Arg/opine family amino ABC transporter, permease, 3-TM region [Bartonella tamiae Th239]EJF92594.1 His/Glu/Gln/Arg/opine family amino ABC transporter, permease, 3-TM region [Bartonella tamiae Th307]